MTAKKETAPADATTETVEHGTNVAGKVDKNLDADGNSIADQDGAKARLETMNPPAGSNYASQAEIAADAKK